jgi:phosphatidylinositol alpha-1,6-mannosyltransferase
MKKKSLLLAEVFPPEKGGIQTWAYELAQNYNEDMVVITPPFKGCSTFDERANFEIIRTGHRPMDSLADKIVGRTANLINPGSGPEIISAYQWLGTAFRLRSKIKSIHSIHIRSSYLAYLFKKWFNIPYFIYIHGLELKSIFDNAPKRKFYSHLLSGASMVFANSDYTARLVAKFGIEEDNIKEVPLGVDYSKFKPGLDVSNLIKRHNLAEDEKIIFSVSRLVKRKGFDLALKAFARLDDSNIKYIIGGSGPEEGNLKQLANDLRISDRVIFTGRIAEEELPLYFNLSDLFVMPSRELKGGDVEGFGIVFLEAGACQVPVIGGNSGGIPSAIEDGQTGYLVEPKNIKEIASKMEKILNNKNLASKMGEVARKRVKEKYNWRNSVNIIKKIESKVIRYENRN